MDDDRIIDLYLARDERAISETSGKYGHALQKIAYRILGDFSAAEECENDAYLKVWNLIPPHEPHGYLFAFVARIVRFLAINK
jgi:RNA polymerase sigma-70 factor (ECF subfamily)